LIVAGIVHAPAETAIMGAAVALDGMLLVRAGNILLMVSFTHRHLDADPVLFATI